MSWFSPFFIFVLFPEALDMRHWKSSGSVISCWVKYFANLSLCPNKFLKQKVTAVNVACQNIQLQRKARLTYDTWTIYWSCNLWQNLHEDKGLVSHLQVLTRSVQVVSSCVNTNKEQVCHICQSLSWYYLEVFFHLGSVPKNTPAWSRCFFHRGGSISINSSQ